MFNSKKDYENAIKNAQLHRKVKSRKLLMFNILFMVVLASFSFVYLKNSKDLSSLMTNKQAVLGVSETVDDSQINNEKLMHILKDRKVNGVENSMKMLSENSTIQSQTSYTEAIARELDDKRNGFKGKIAVVNQKN